MSEAHPTAPAGSGKPAKPSKPYPDFPLFPHAAGVLGQEDPRQDALLRPVGRPRRRPGEVPGAEGRPARRPQAPARHRRALTVKELANAFLNAKQALRGRRRAVAPDLGATTRRRAM